MLTRLDTTHLVCVRDDGTIRLPTTLSFLQGIDVGRLAERGVRCTGYEASYIANWMRYLNEHIASVQGQVSIQGSPKRT